MSFTRLQQVTLILSPDNDRLLQLTMNQISNHASVKSDRLKIVLVVSYKVLTQTEGSP